MNPLRQTSMDPRSQEHLAGDVDQFLREYFRREMPEPWPAMKAPTNPPSEANRPPVRRSPMFRSRFALAASLLLLLLGHLLLSGVFSDFSPVTPDRTPERIIGKNPHGPGKHPKPNVAPRSGGPRA